MKIRKRIRHESLPTDFTIGWRNYEPIVRLSKAQADLAERLNIPIEEVAKAMLEKMKLTGSNT